LRNAPLFRRLLFDIPARAPLACDPVFTMAATNFKNFLGKKKDRNQSGKIARPMISKRLPRVSIRDAGLPTRLGFSNLSLKTSNFSTFVNS
jgi:hypothetical protein